MPHTRPEAPDWASMSIQDILTLAIADEQDARDYYRHAAALAGSMHTRKVLLALAAMEQEHADTLRRELEEIVLQRESETGIAD